MDQSQDLEQLRQLAKDKKRGHGARLKKALLLLSFPATALMCTACYAAAMEPIEPVEPTEVQADTADTDDSNVTVTQPQGFDCDGDGIADVSDSSECGAPQPDPEAQSE